jgi:predicted HAD superfamily Cof-like phosphohydrolase
MKETADVQYIVSGMNVTFGLPADQVFDRVHDSNMSKLGDDGKPVRRDDGKVMKGPNYHPPTLDDLIDVIPVPVKDAA